MNRTLCSALLLLSLTLPAQAQGVIIVDAAGGGDFTEIQPAVDAAAPGSLIRIRHGTYQGATIRKGIRLIGDRPDPVDDIVVLIDGSIRVLDLPSNQAFVATDLFLLLSGAEPRSFNFEDCRGNVHISHSIGRLKIRRCNYVTADLMRGEGSSAEHGVLVEDSFLIATYSEWDSSFIGAPEPMKAIRSKVILVKVVLFNFNGFGTADPLTSALVLIDSELIDAGAEFIVFCDPAVRPCPPLIKLVGDSTVEEEGIRGGVVLANINELDLLRLRYWRANSVMDAVIAALPIRPVELPEGTLYANLAASALLHLGPPPPGLTVEIDLVPPPGNRLGLPITFQAASLLRSGEIKLSIPLTIVF